MPIHEDLTHEFHNVWKSYFEPGFKPLPCKDWVHPTADPDTRVFINFGDFRVTRAHRNMIPAIAAISHNAPVEKLAEIILHHEITLGQINELVVIESVSFGKAKTNKELSQWNLTHRLTQAFFHDPQHLQDFSINPAPFSNSHEDQVASLLLPIDSLWPATKIARYIEERLENSGSTRLRPYKVEANSFEAGRINLECLSNDQIITMIERSGNLHLEADEDHGYSSEFFKFVLTYLDTSDTENPNHRKMCEAICALEDPLLIEAFRLKIIAELSNCEVYHEFHGCHLLRGIEKSLPYDKFGSITDSMTIKINVLSFEDDGVEGEQNDPDYGVTTRIPNRLNRSEAIQGLNDELMGLEPGQFKRQHFNALHKVADDFSEEHTVGSIDLNALLIHVLNGFDAYRNRCGNGMAKSDLTQQAEDQAGVFTSFVRTRCAPDYGQFNQLPSSAQGVLAINGYDARKLSGLNRRDRGRALENGMGL